MYRSGYVNVPYTSAQPRATCRHHSMGGTGQPSVIYQVQHTSSAPRCGRVGGCSETHHAQWACSVYGCVMWLGAGRGALPRRRPVYRNRRWYLRGWMRWCMRERRGVAQHRHKQCMKTYKMAHMSPTTGRATPVRIQDGPLRTMNHIHPLHPPPRPSFLTGRM